MRTLWRRVALRFGIASLCLAAAIALAASRLASLSGDVLATADGVSARNSADVTASIGESASARSLPLSEEQRGHIFDGIMRIHDAPTADVALPEFVTALPSSVALQELPVNVTREIPLLQGYKFVKLEDRILLVSPVDRSVVAQMPRYRTLLD
jgi:Protein of unknown function (DUF1236)